MVNVKYYFYLVILFYVFIKYVFIFFLNFLILDMDAKCLTPDKNNLFNVFSSANSKII